MPAPIVQVMTAASEVLRWPAPVIGPVVFGGVEFWASVKVDQREHERRIRKGEVGHIDRGGLERQLSPRRSAAAGRPRPPLRLEGILVMGEHAEQAVRAASYFAGYCRRAAIVSDRAITVECAAVAAMVDVGLITLCESGDVVQLTGCGPRASGGSFNAREWHLLETVYQAMRADAGEIAMSP